MSSIPLVWFLYGIVQSSISTHSFSDVPSQKYLNPEVRNNKLVNGVSLPTLFFKISPTDTSFHISLNSLGVYLSRMLAEFSMTFIFHHVWEKCFNLWCWYSQKMHWIYAFLLVPQSHIQNSRWTFLKICFPRNGGGGRKLWFAQSKSSQKVWRWLGTLVYLDFV